MHAEEVKHANTTLNAISLCHHVHATGEGAHERSEFAVCNRLARANVLREVAHGEANHQQRLRRFRCAHDLLRFLGIDSERLLNEHRLTSGSRGLGCGEMQMIRERDDHRLNARMRKKFVCRCVRGCAVLSCNFCGDIST